MGSKKILLVEDDPNFGTVLKDYLALNDYNVTLAKDGIEGLIMFKNSDYDMCILDVMMPRKDGFSLAQDIRATNKEIPIIFLTAKTLKEDVLKGYSVGADDYLNNHLILKYYYTKLKQFYNEKNQTKLRSQIRFLSLQSAVFHSIQNYVIYPRLQLKNQLNCLKKRVNC